MCLLILADAFSASSYGIREDFEACEKMDLLFVYLVYLAVSPPVCLLPNMSSENHKRQTATHG